MKGLCLWLADVCGILTSTIPKPAVIAQSMYGGEVILFAG